MRDMVDNPHKAKFVELFEKYQIALTGYLKNSGSDVDQTQMEEYASFHKEIKASHQSI